MSILDKFRAVIFKDKREKSDVKQDNALVIPKKPTATDKWPAFPKIGNVEPKCPYCDYILNEKPGRKKMCPNCKKYIYVRTRPSDRERVLIKEEQITQIEEQWVHYREQQEIENLESDSEYVEMRDKLAKRLGTKELLATDVLWALANRHLLAHARNRDWGLYTNTKLDMARILERINKPEIALQTYLEICYLDINGPSNTGGITDSELLKEFPPFDPDQGLFAPAIVDSIRRLADKLGMQPDNIKEMFFKTAEKNCVNLKLPVGPNKAWDMLYQELDKSTE